MPHFSPMSHSLETFMSWKIKCTLNFFYHPFQPFILGRIYTLFYIFLSDNFGQIKKVGLAKNSQNTAIQRKSYKIYLFWSLTWVYISLSHGFAISTDARFENMWILWKSTKAIFYNYSAAVIPENCNCSKIQCSQIMMTGGNVLWSGACDASEECSV